MLTTKHKYGCIEWVQKHKRLKNLKWNTVIVLDEKKLNLDEPNGLFYFLYNVKKGKRTWISKKWVKVV